MQISLTETQRVWLDAVVARGEFASADEAVRRLIDARIIEESGDLAWAKPYVDAAVAAVERGEVIDRDEHRARNATRLASLKD